MDINLFRKKLAEAISKSPEWTEKLNDTVPGHYGVEGMKIDIGVRNVFVNIPDKTFEFNNVKFDFDLTMGSSSDGMEDSFSKTANGKGAFDYSEDKKDIIIHDLEIEVNLDLYA